MYIAQLIQCLLQALIARVAREVEAESGVDLEQLINPSKVHTTTPYMSNSSNNPYLVLKLACTADGVDYLS